MCVFDYILNVLWNKLNDINIDIEESLVLGLKVYGALSQ